MKKMYSKGRTITSWRGEGEGFGNFPQKKSCTEKTETKSCKRSSGEKSNKCCPVFEFFSIFILKRTLAQAIAQEKIHAQILAQRHLKK